jgi:hypothetical protein
VVVIGFSVQIEFLGQDSSFLADQNQLPGLEFQGDFSEKLFRLKPRKEFFKLLGHRFGSYGKQQCGPQSGKALKIVW